MIVCISTLSISLIDFDDVKSRFWGFITGLLNHIPYFGSLVGIVIVAIASFIIFEDSGRVILVPFLYLLLTALEGSFITPLIHGLRLIH